MKKVLLFVLALSTAVILAACGGEKKTENDVQTFKTYDEKYQVSASKEWKAPKGEEEEGMLHPEASLEAYTPRNEKYIMALMESKEDFVDTSLQDYFDIVTEMFQSSLTDVNAGEVKEVTINGNKALQYELQGVIDGLKVAYFVTVIETPEDFGQVLTWTVGSKWDEYKDELKAVVNSFEEVK